MLGVKWRHNNYSQKEKHQRNVSNSEDKYLYSNFIELTILHSTEKTGLQSNLCEEMNKLFL